MPVLVYILVLSIGFFVTLSTVKLHSRVKDPRAAGGGSAEAKHRSPPLVQEQLCSTRLMQLWPSSHYLTR
eukprot:12145401-Alexandrium_andersonii.AAC.1